MIFLTGRVMGYLGRVRLTHNKIGSGHRSTHFCFGSKKWGLGQVFFGSGQKILTRIAMSIGAAVNLLLQDLELNNNNNNKKLLHHVPLTRLYWIIGW